MILNGQTIIDNQPVLGCTGGALWSDPLRPGPIYLQGNHSDIDYRNIVLRPVISHVAVKAPKPHIVLMLAAISAGGDVGFHGSKIKTPHIDALAASGVRLNQFYAQPVCSPTRGALMTGRYPMRLGLPVRRRSSLGRARSAARRTHLARGAQGGWLRDSDRRQMAFGSPVARVSPDAIAASIIKYGHYNGALDYFTHNRDGGFDWHKNDRRNDDVGYATELIGRKPSVSSPSTTRRSRCSCTCLSMPRTRRCKRRRAISTGTPACRTRGDVPSLPWCPAWMTRSVA